MLAIPHTPETLPRLKEQQLRLRTGSNADPVEELQTRMNFGGGAGTLFDVVRGLSRTLSDSQPAISTLTDLEAYAPRYHAATERVPLATESSEASLKVPLGELPSQPSGGLLASQRELPPPSAYNLLTEEGVAAYKSNRGVTTVWKDDAYRLERKRQAERAHRRDPESRQKVALSKKRYHQKKSGDEAFKQQNALRSQQYRQAKKDDAHFKQLKAIRQKRYVQKKKLQAQGASNGEPVTELPHLTAPLDSTPVDPAGLSSSTFSSVGSERKPAADVSQEKRKRKSQSTSGKQVRKLREARQPSVRSGSGSRERLSTTVDPFAGSSPRYSVPPLMISRVPETGLTPTSPDPHLWDLEVLEFARQLLTQSP